MPEFFIHKTAEVQTESIGNGTTIWQFVVILDGAVIGANCNINSHVLIENDVLIGDNVTVKSGVQIWDGVTLEDDVFIGPNVTFTNDILPRSKQYPLKFEKTLLKSGASVGANATIIAGNIIGEKAMIGAGTVITKDVKKQELWVGNPGKHVGYIANDGEILNLEFTGKKNKKKYHWDLNVLKVEE
jgi:acetyltransferase-like isoleucine patch superfamily enzyme